MEQQVGNAIDAVVETAIGSAGEHLNSLGAVAGVSLAAMIFGLAFIMLRQPPIVGYILAGAILGPTGMGFVSNTESITLLAELGVLLLLFLIGMEISIRAFVMVLVPSVIVMATQVTAGVAVAFVFGWMLGWSAAQSLLLGFVVAVSSTAVAIKILDDIGELRSETGRITIGVMVAQDIAIVPMMIIAESFGASGGGFTPWTAFTILASIGFLGLLIWYLNKPGKIRLPFSGHLAGKPDVMSLAALTFCFTAASFSALLGLSAVYGAFVAGLIIANSTLRSEMIQLTYPVQSILVFVFFLSVGLLIDLDFVLANIGTVTAFVFATVLVKTVLNVYVIRRVGLGWSVALPAGLAMAQIGEFSFILAAVGMQNRVLDEDAYRLAIAVISMSLVISPIWMTTVRRFHEATSRGLTDLREALAITYAPEIEEFVRGRNLVSRGLYRARIYARAARIARRRRRRLDDLNAAFSDRKRAENGEPDSAKAAPEGQQREGAA